MIVDRLADAISGFFGGRTVKWAGGVWPSSTSAAGVTVNQSTALTSSAVWACVRIISESLASLPLHLYRDTDDGGHEEATDDPIYKIVSIAPNDVQTGMHFRESRTAHALTWGNGYGFIQRDLLGNPLKIWPLRPDRVKPRIDNDTLVYDRYLPDGNTQTYLSDDILHIAGLGFDGIEGYSVVSMFANAIGLGIAAERFSANFFGNGAIPSAVLQHPGVIGDAAAVESLRQSITQQTSGKNSLSLLVLEEGMEYRPMGIPQKDAQFLESRQFQVEEIARIFRVPQHMVGKLDRATFTNIEHQSIEFVRGTLVPWARRWEQELARKLIPPSRAGERLSFAFDFTDLLRGDSASRVTYLRGLFDMGALTINEIRQQEGWSPPFGNGNTNFLQGAMRTVDSIEADDVYRADSAADSPPASDASANAIMTHDQLIAAHRIAFESPLDRLAAKDVTAMGRSTWTNDAAYWGRAAEVLRAALIPAVETLAAVAWAIGPLAVVSEYPAKAVGAATAEFVAWYIDAARETASAGDASALRSPTRISDAATKAMSMILAAIQEQQR